MTSTYSLGSLAENWSLVLDARGWYLGPYGTTDFREAVCRRDVNFSRLLADSAMDVMTK